MKNFLRCLQKFVLDLEFPTVAVLVAAGMVSSRWLPAALVGVVFFWLIRWLLIGQLNKRTSADWGLAVLLLIVPVTLWATLSLQTTLPQVLRLLGGIALFYALTHWVNSSFRLRELAATASAVGLALALSALVMVTWPIDKYLLPAALYQQFVLLVSDTVNPNVMAGSLVLLAPLPLSALLFAWREQRWIERLLSLLSAIGMVGVLVLTQSRSAWLALAACLFVLVALRWRWGWLAIALAVVGVILVIEHFGATRLLEALLAGGSIAGVEGRIEIWQRALFMIRDFPITGIGMGDFGHVVDTFYPFYIYKASEVPHAHNLFLQIAVDLGLPGLIAWLSLLFIATTAAWHSYRFGQHYSLRWMAGLGAGLLLSQLALVLHGLTDAVTWGTVRSAPLVWFTWGLAVSSANLVVMAKRIKKVPDSTTGS
jgi:putative inorganic carbon (HCO3(-)) transporter